MQKVLFVCLGNICRSPMAEGMFLHLLSENSLLGDFEVDSAGTAAYHTGNLSDQRMRETAASHNVFLESRARQVNVADFNSFDFIVAMDEENQKNLLQLSPKGATAKVVLMRDYDPELGDKNVPDPYYGGVAGFEEVYQILERSCKQFLNQITQ